MATSEGKNLHIVSYEGNMLNGRPIYVMRTSEQEGRDKVLAKIFDIKENELLRRAPSDMIEYARAVQQWEIHHKRMMEKEEEHRKLLIEIQDLHRQQMCEWLEYWKNRALESERRK
jgi:hypothetical protein